MFSILQTVAHPSKGVFMFCPVLHQVYCPYDWVVPVCDPGHTSTAFITFIMYVWCPNSANLWCLFLCQLMDEQILCVHGGLSPDIKTLDQIRTIERNQEIPHKGAFCDLVWSDPEDVDTWAISPRGAGWLFGAKVTNEVIAFTFIEFSSHWFISARVV